MVALKYYKFWTLREYAKVKKGEPKYVISGSYGAGLYACSNSRDIIMKKWDKLKSELKSGKKIVTH
jgi:hypothetical protein